MLSRQAGCVTDDSDDYSGKEAAAINAFRETALEMVRWHLTRVDGFERKAATLLGLGGLALAVVPFAVNDLAGLAPWARGTVRVATATAATSLWLAGVFCLQTLRPKRNASAAPETRQFEDAWAKFRADRDLTAGDVNGMFADSLLSPDEPRPPVVVVLKELAQEKGRWLGQAAWCVAVAVTGLTIAVVFALLGAE